MKNELKVFYKNDKGLYTFDNNKRVFQHREGREGVEVGLGIFKEDSVIYDRGNYAFAIFKNVDTCIPDSYYTLPFYSNRGVPLKIERGHYGNNILLRETYRERVYIRAYREDGSIGLYESDKIKNDNYDGVNVYFLRIDKLIEDWEDITNDVVERVIEDVKNLSCSVNMSDDVVFNALKGLSHNKIYRLDSGVFVADGKFESLLIWTENSDVKMTWLGRKLNLDLFKYEDVTDVLLELLNKVNE